MEATSDKFKFVPALCHGGQCGGTNTGSAQSKSPRYRCHLGCILLKIPAISLLTGGGTVSIESCSTPGTFLRHCYYHIWAGVFGTGPDYDFTWVLQEGDVAGSVQMRTTANQFGDRDIEVIPSDAPFSNIGQNNGAREYGLTMVLDGAYQNWFLQATDSPQGAARLLGGDGPLQRNILLGQIDVRTQPPSRSRTPHPR